MEKSEWIKRDERGKVDKDPVINYIQGVIMERNNSYASGAEI